ncbi:MAG: PH domain-containing protein [Actinomycetota bacterium]|nr:PH domain-containing protein [Actinomycetota bacterium]
MPAVNAADGRLEVRPILMSRIGYAACVSVLLVFVAVAIAMPRANAGAHFGVKDQLGTAVIGIVVAALFLMLTWPRLTADTSGLRMRSFLGSWRTVPWDLVIGVEFPSKVRFARLVLPGDETIVLYAVQRLDTDQSIEVMRHLRALLAASRPTP